jgi:UDP-N-acetylmuramate--alanine ligase
LSFLPELFNDDQHHIHFVGVGGINMSALAEMMLEKGFIVSGSDLHESPLTKSLRKKGAHIYIGHQQSNVSDADLVVHTAAVDETNPEIFQARQEKLPVISRAKLLGSVMTGYPNSIGISGTHGKTTTTSMLSVIMNEANFNPTIMIGGNLKQIGGNYQAGGSNYFIAEACEYQESFLSFKPYVAVLLNIESDHLDYYRDLDHIYDAFLQYASSVPPNGTVIGCSDDALVQRILSSVSSQTLTYSLHGMGSINATHITYDTQGCATFDCCTATSTHLASFKLSVPGLHNVYNALAAITTAMCFHIPFDVISSALSSFLGVDRRFQIKGQRKGALIVDDYAHHPTEIKAALKAANAFSHQRIICVFQPHTFTRTKQLFDEFVTSFEDANLVFINDIYAAREKDTHMVSSKELAEAIALTGKDCTYCTSFESTVEKLNTILTSGDILITMGAGDIYKVGDMLLTF